jgi:predicted nuclease of predicted toxin-antitoxin system
MKFLVDAQLPYRLAKFLKAKGYDAIHTDDMPGKERTSDSEIRSEAKADQRFVISKDKDFYNSHLLNKEPAKLLLVSTGNIVNLELLALFEANWDEIEDKFQSCDLLELTNTQLTGYEIS